MLDRQRQRKAQEEAFINEMQNKDKRRSSPKSTKRASLLSVSKFIKLLDQKSEPAAPISTPAQAPPTSSKQHVQKKRYKTTIVSREYFLERNPEESTQYFNFKKNELISNMDQTQHRFNLLESMRKASENDEEEPLTLFQETVFS